MTTENKRKKLIVTVTGASAAGKDTLVDSILCLTNPDKTPNEGTLPAYCKSHLPAVACNAIELISHTTRSPRAGEINGVDYYFVDRAELEDLAKVEYTEYAGNQYSLAVAELERIKDIGLVIVDKHGVSCIEEFVNNHSDEYALFTIFLACTEDIARQRMLSRGDSAESVERRLAQHRERNEYSTGSRAFSLIIGVMSEDPDVYSQTVSAIMNNILAARA